MLKKEDVHYLANNPQKVYQELDILRSVNQGDFIVTIAPLNPTNQIKVAVANTGGIQRTVEFDLVNVRGFLHEWYSGTMVVTATKVSTAGVVAIGSTNLVGGKVIVSVTLSGVFAVGDSITLTITPPTIKGLNFLATAPVLTDVVTIIA